MKKWLFVAAVVAALVLYFSSSRYGISLGPVRWAFSPDRHAVELAMRRFLEDVQFKDFTHAATFHTAEDRKTKDIPRLIEEKFHVKPELLDIKDFDVLRVELMSTGSRAKVHVKTFVKLLNSDQAVRETEAVFYFKREPDGRWYMDLQSSL